MRFFILAFVGLAGCAAPGAETLVSRERLNCAYHAQYDDPSLTIAQRDALMRKCGP